MSHKKQFFRHILLILALIAATIVAENAEAAPVPFSLPPANELMKLRSAKLETTKGDIFIELYPEDAPWHVANWKYLADKGFYRGLPFHIYQADYIIQGGAPGGEANGGPGYSLPNEFSQRRHEVGTIGMARMPDSVNPERLSHGSQFHILLTEAPHMNGMYSVFGKVVTGMDVVEKLRRGDKILDLKVYVRE